MEVIQPPSAPSSVVEDKTSAHPESTTSEKKRTHPDATLDDENAVKRQKPNESEDTKTMGRNKYKQSRSQRQKSGHRDTRNKEIQRRGEPDGEPRPATGTEDGEPAAARQPKKKVAVLIGYAGTGYKGMQMTKGEKTIESDLFAAFCAAGAISKDNSDDPKKSSFVRCARTDKGVHAAGNVVSLKLIVEDEGIVQKINANLPAQIRVWGIVPTVGSFSCYTQCDSRVYEYLLPSYCLLPPDPRSPLAKKMHEVAKEVGDLNGYLERQTGDEDFWPALEREELQPYLQTLEPTVREIILGRWVDEEPKPEPTSIRPPQDPTTPTTTTAPTSEDPAAPTLATKLKLARAHLRTLTLQRKRRHRISPARVERLRSVLACYLGSRPFHNYTIRVAAGHPSAVRTIKSFSASDPFLVPSSASTNDSSGASTSEAAVPGEIHAAAAAAVDPAADADATEWISLRIHGQSFMMHQIRKMTAMAVLMLRSGSPPSLIHATTQKRSRQIPIPKAPALGLLLDRPVFETYNSRATEQLGRVALEFEPYKEEMEAFRRREIYGRVFEGEGREGVFESFFGFVDGFQAEDFAYLSSKGLEGYRGPKGMGVPLAGTGAGATVAEAQEVGEGTVVGEELVDEDQKPGEEKGEGRSRGAAWGPDDEDAVTLAGGEEG